MPVGGGDFQVVVAVVLADEIGQRVHTLLSTADGQRTVDEVVLRINYQQNLLHHLAAIHSISTKAPFGSVFTATAERAGNGSLKKVE